MRTEPRNVAMGVLLAILVLAFYPTLTLGRRLAPESSLRSVAPWRHELGPSPDPPVRVLAAATQLGPRLAVIARSGFAAAVWNPWIGGGRPGWLSSPREGGAPLPVAAAIGARPAWVWTALVALTIACSFTSSWMVARWSGAGGWAAAAAATAYALAAPVSGHWLDWRGSAVALGPIALLPALSRSPSWGRRTAAWAGAIAVVLLAGTPAVPFVALALAREVVPGARQRAARRWAAVGVGVLLALLVRLPSAWIERSGVESGARVTAARQPPPPATLRSLVRLREPVPATARAGAAASAPDESAAAPAFLGFTTLILAVAGLAAAGSRDRLFWGAAAAAALGMALAPTAWLAAVGVSQRPLAALALAVAVLAATGLDVLLRRIPPALVPIAGAAACLALIAELAPAALHELPYATPKDAQLQLPVPRPLPADGSRVLAMMSALPPDVAAEFGISDVRGRSFDGEPRYEELIRSRRGVDEVMDPVYAKLGVRWVLEPAPLRVVSGLVFGDIDVVEATRVSADGATTGRYRLTVPADACRLGLPTATAGAGAVFLQGPDTTVALEEDRALAEESSEWRWVAVRPGAPRGDAVLGVIGEAAAPPSLSVAVDVSGMRLAAEDQGGRLWEWTRGAPFVRLVGAGSGTVEVDALAERNVAVRVHADRPGVLAVQVKFRPALWRATIDGAPARTRPIDEVWTGVEVPAGDSRVALRATIPPLVAGSPLAAVIMGALLALYRRTR